MFAWLSTWGDPVGWMIAGAVVAVLAAAALGFWFAPPARRSRQRRAEEKAVRRFRFERERLEARFLELARAAGKPKGLRWLDCDWLSETAFARDTTTGLITAFASINVRFEAVEGGGMEDVEAVGTVRDAAAVFHYQNGHWGTGGRSLFNMNPSAAVERLAGQYEPIATAEWRGR